MLKACTTEPKPPDVDLTYPAKNFRAPDENRISVPKRARTKCKSEPGDRVAELVLAICSSCCSYGGAVADVAVGAALGVAAAAVVAAAAAAAEVSADDVVETAVTIIVGTFVSTPTHAYLTRYELRHAFI